MLTLLCVCLINPVFAGGIEFEHISIEEARKKAAGNGKLIFVDVFTTWCGPCKYLSSEVFTDDDLGAYMNSHFISVKLDAEREGEDFAVQHEVDAYPTMLMLSADGEVVGRIVGAVGADEILEHAKLRIEPENTDFGRAKKQFEDGDHSRESMTEYLYQSIVLEMPYDQLIIDYFTRFPDMDFSDDEEALIFYMGTDDWNHPVVKDFIANFEAKAEENPEIALKKIQSVTGDLLRVAVEKQDFGHIGKHMGTLYECFNLVMEDSLSESELKEALKESYDESISE